MNWTIEFAKHSERAAEARRPIAVAAGQTDSASKRTDVRRALILDGLRAPLWLAAAFVAWHRRR